MRRHWQGSLLTKNLSQIMIILWNCRKIGDHREKNHRDGLGGKSWAETVRQIGNTPTSRRALSQGTTNTPGEKEEGITHSWISSGWFPETIRVNVNVQWVILARFLLSRSRIVSVQDALPTLVCWPAWPPPGQWLMLPECCHAIPLPPRSIFADVIEYTVYVQWADS